MYKGAYDLVVPKDNLGSFGALFVQIISSSKMTRHREKRNEIWESGTVFQYIVGTIDLVVVRVLWGHPMGLSKLGLVLGYIAAKLTSTFASGQA